MLLASKKSPILEILSSKAKLSSATSVMSANIILILVGSFLLAISAQYKVPLGPVPITLQSMVVMLIATIYGWRLGTATIIAYWTEGILVGGLFSFLPWFANGSGLTYFIGSPSAGFLWGFLPMVFVVGYLNEVFRLTETIVKLFLSLILGQGVLYTFGLAHAYFIVMPYVDWMNSKEELFMIYLYPFIIGDLLKTMIASLISIYFLKKRT